MPDYLPEQGPSIPLSFKGPVISLDIQTLLMLSSSSVCLHKLWVVKKSMACCWVIWIHLVVCSATVVCNFLDLHEHLNSTMYMFCELTMTVCYNMQYGWIVCLNSYIATNKSDLSIVEHLPGQCSAILHFTFHHLSRFDQLFSFSIITKYIWDRSSELQGESSSEYISKKKKNTKRPCMWIKILFFSSHLFCSVRIFLIKCP